MSFRSEAANVRSKLASGSFEKANPDPYGFKGFAEQVTFGIRADAEQRRQEELMEKKDEFARKRAAAAKQEAKEAADKKLRGYVTTALQAKVGGYGTPLTDQAGLVTMTDQVYNYAMESGATSYSQVEALVGNISNTAFDNLFTPVDQAATNQDSTPTDGSEVDYSSNTVPIYHNGYKIIPNADGSVVVEGGTIGRTRATPPDLSALKKLLSGRSDGGFSAPEDQTEAALNESSSVSTDIATAADAVTKQSDSLFGNPDTTKLDGLAENSWETEVARLENLKATQPNRAAFLDGEINKIRDYAGKRGWTKVGGLTAEQLLDISYEDLLKRIANIEGGLGNVDPADLPILKEALAVKEAVNAEGMWWNDPQKTFELLDSKPNVVDSQIKFWANSGNDANAERLENVQNLKTIYDSVVNGQGLDADTLSKVVGKDSTALNQFKSMYYDSATGQQKGLIDKAISIAEESEMANKAPKSLAWDSWANRTRLYENLGSDDPAIVQKAEESVALWEQLWSRATNIADKPTEWWQNESNIAKLSLDEIENLLVMPSIQSNAAAQNALLPVKNRLTQQQTSTQVNETEGDIFSLKTVADMDNWLLGAGNAERLSNEPALEAQWVNQRANILSAENAADAEKNIDAYQQIWRNELGDRKLTDLSSAEIAEIDTRAKALTSTEGEFKTRTYYKDGNSVPVNSKEDQAKYEADGWSPIKLGDVSQMLADLNLVDNPENRALVAKVKNGVFKITSNNVGYPILLELTGDAANAQPIGTGGGDLSLGDSRKLVMEEVANTIGAAPDDLSGDTLATDGTVIMTAAEKQEALNGTQQLGFEQSIANLTNPSAAFGPRGWGSGILNKITGLGKGTFDEATAEARTSINTLRLITTLQISAAFPGLKDSVNLRTSIQNNLPETGRFWTSVPEAKRGYTAIRDLLVTNVQTQQNIMDNPTDIRGIDFAKSNVAVKTLEPLIEIYNSLIEGMDQVEQVTDNSTLNVQDTSQVPENFSKKTAPVVEIPFRVVDEALVRQYPSLSSYLGKKIRTKQDENGKYSIEVEGE